MNTWRPVFVVALFLSAFSVSCAQGGAVLPADAAVGTGSGQTDSLCGNGVVDKGEVCDCGPDFKSGSCQLQDLAQTCGKLNEGTGTLLCDSATCTFDTKACSGTGSGGTGGGGTSG